MSLPNKLTLIRFHLTFLFIFVVSFESFSFKILSLFIFVIAALTDWYDGYLARKNKLESNYGRVFDPLADKVLTCSAYIFFVKANFFADLSPQISGIPAWIVSLIITREFAVSGLRTLAVYDKTELVTSKLGKYKTTSQFIAIISILLISIIDFGFKKYYPNVPIPTWLLNINIYIPLILMLITLVATWVSGIDYIIRNNETFYNLKKDNITPGK